MGYSHYFNRPEKLAQKTFNNLRDEVEEIIKKSNVAIVGSMGERGTKPTLTNELISFNGSGSYSHETLHIPRVIVEGEDFYTKENNLAFQFCKTAEKPYDKVVVEVLKAFKRHFPKVILSSDGGSHIFNQE
jgi:hypothetical protein